MPLLDFNSVLPDSPFSLEFSLLATSNFIHLLFTIKHEFLLTLGHINDNKITKIIGTKKLYLFKINLFLTLSLDSNSCFNTTNIGQQIRAVFIAKHQIQNRVITISGKITHIANFFLDGYALKRS